MRLGTATALAALAAASLAIPVAAAAADMPSYYLPPAAATPPNGPLTFGSGWYLRGDASFGPEDRPKLLLEDNVPTFGRGGSTFGYAFGAGAGYRFTDWFRADVTADYLDPFDYAANLPCGTNCAINKSTELERWDGLVNGYVDLGTWAGFTPYVGAGVGVAGVHETGTIGLNGAPLSSGVIDPRTGTLVSSSVPGRTSTQFAWAAMAGLSYAVAPNTLIDVGYRYLDLGRTAISLFPSTSVTRGLSAQQIRVGVRYMID